MVADVLSQITTHLSLEHGHAIQPGGSNPGCHPEAEGGDPAMVVGDYDIEKETCVTAGQVLVEMHVTNWPQPKEMTQY